MSASYSRNAIFNLMGGVLPALITLFTIPFIVHQLGDVNYGVLTLITSIIGYFALLDVNVTAGSVKFVAQHNASGKQREVNETVSFGMIIYALIGLVGFAAICLLSDWLIQRAFKIPAAQQPDAARALSYASFGFLLGQLQTYLQSIPQALQRYDLSARVEATFGTLVPLATVGLLALGHGLVELVLLRVVASAVHCGVLLVVIRRLMPWFRPAWPGAATRGEIVSFSAYSFLSRIAAVSYSHADKLLIGALAGAQQVAYFAVASTLANRVLSLSSRLSSVIFPTASAMAARNEHSALTALYLSATRYMLFINGAVVLVLAAFSEPILALWMGPRFAEQGALIMSVVALGLWVDSLTNVPSLVNDGLGHPRVSGLFAVTRAVLGLVLLATMIKLSGAPGAAWAHLMASAVMTMAFLLYVHGRTVPVSLADVMRASFAPGVCALFVSAMAAVPLASLPLTNWAALLLTVGCCGLVLLATGWFWVVQPQHKVAISERYRAALGRRAT